MTLICVCLWFDTLCFFHLLMILKISSLSLFVLITDPPRVPVVLYLVLFPLTDDIKNI